MDIEIPDIKFDEFGMVIGKYYGTCPTCKRKANLTFEKNNKWVCRKCYYGR